MTHEAVRLGFALKDLTEITPPRAYAPGCGVLNEHRPRANRDR